MHDDIEWIIERLRSPLRPEEAQAGWTADTKDGYVKVFADLLSRLQSDKPVPYLAMGRSLDGFGVGDGELYERMLKVTNETNQKWR